MKIRASLSAAVVAAAVVEAAAAWEAAVPAVVLVGAAVAVVRVAALVVAEVLEEGREVARVADRGVVVLTTVVALAADPEALAEVVVLVPAAVSEEDSRLGRWNAGRKEWGNLEVQGALGLALAPVAREGPGRE